MKPLLELAWEAAEWNALTLYRALRGHSRSRLRIWRQSADGAGLQHVESSRRAGLLARSGGLDIHIANTGIDTRVLITGLGHRPQELAFCAERVGDSIERAWSSRTEIELGDPGFDDEVYLAGSPELACAVFDAETRQLVRRLIEGNFGVPLHNPLPDSEPRVTLRDGELVGLFPHSLFERFPGRSAHVLKAMVAAAQRLVRPRDLVARLVDNLEREPEAAVRLKNLQVLLERYPRHPRARAALNDALGDRNDEVRLRAALALETPAARETLLGIACGEHSADEHAARAVGGLGEYLALKQVRSILEQALRRRREATAEACLLQLARRGRGQGIGLLQKVLALEKGFLAAAAARALGASGRREAEPPLLAALDRHSPETLTAVARALARVGTAAAVLPLRAASEHNWDSGFRSAARQAIAAIQSRLEGASPGQLSLAENEAGQLTLAEDDDGTGRLSLPDTPKTPSS